MSFKIRLSKKDRSASRFLAQLHAAFANAALTEAKGPRRLTRKQVADELGVDKSVVSRILTGGGNPTARTIGELAWAMGYRPELLLHKIEQATDSNSIAVKKCVAGKGYSYSHSEMAHTLSLEKNKPFKNLNEPIKISGDAVENVH